MSKNKPILQIKNLTVAIEDKQILNSLNLELESGKIHVIMGRNGSGKSTLGKTIMGSFETEVRQGEILFEGEDITQTDPSQRSHLGIFLANQYPMEIPGVNLEKFLRLAYNSRFTDPKQQLSVLKFNELLKEKLALIGLDEEFAKRNLNEGFSGGEKKKCEILQLAVLNPKLAILDETDSGLDVDALAEVFGALSKLKEQNKELTLLIITHYERIFRYIKPDQMHLISKGQIVKTGDQALLKQIQKEGFKSVID